MAIAQMTEITRNIILDELDSGILKTLNTSGTSLQEIASKFPEYRYMKVRYRILSLEKLGLLHTAKKRKQVICFPSRS